MTTPFQTQRVAALSPSMLEVRVFHVCCNLLLLPMWYLILDFDVFTRSQHGFHILLQRHGIIKIWNLMIKFATQVCQRFALEIRNRHNCQFGGEGNTIQPQPNLPMRVDTQGSEQPLHPFNYTKISCEGTVSGRGITELYISHLQHQPNTLFALVAPPDKHHRVERNVAECVWGCGGLCGFVPVFTCSWPLCVDLGS